jgi:D-alanine--poly(phosphoribitol) ligase subunit 1
MKYNFYKNSFEETGKNKDKIVISGSDKDITWEQLKLKVQQLKEILKKIKVPQGHPVIIYGHKEHFFTVAILTLINSNIPYIPVDKIYPFERLKKIADITGSQIIINCGEYNLNIDIPIEIDYNFTVKKNKEPCYSNKIYGDSCDPLRYIMFTSGSTGEPKGVQINNSSILSFIHWIKKDYHFTANDVFMNQSPFTFDVSLYDLLSAMMLGATVLLINTEISKLPDKLFKKLRDYHCSIWTSTPSFVYLYLREKDFISNYLSKLKTFLFAGEDIPPRTVKILKEKFPDAKIYNAYGPTEATVTTTLIEITDDILNNYQLLPIGYPKRDSEILIDIQGDEKKTGEILIIGDHVSTGYFKNDDLNKKKFFTHMGKRGFRTGDLGYYENGMIFFTGRNDDQVKFHGYRIELGEINTVIRNLDFIEDAVTVPLKRGNEVKRIITFVIIKQEYENIKSDLKNKIIHDIINKVPPYMIPGDIKCVKIFPVNINHKIDKLKLAEMYRSNIN